MFCSTAIPLIRNTTKEYSVLAFVMAKANKKQRMSSIDGVGGDRGQRSKRSRRRKRSKEGEQEWQDKWETNKGRWMAPSYEICSSYISATCTVHYEHGNLAVDVTSVPSQFWDLFLAMNSIRFQRSCNQRVL